jgi:uncharacterized iron-regulated protein
VIWWIAAAALAQECERIGLGDVLAVPPPAVIVLGERHGTQPDLRRADQVVFRLSQSGHPVTVGLEAVHHEYQRVLDEYAQAAMDPGDLPHLLEWDDKWGFPFRPYQPLVTAALHDATVVAAGLDLGPQPEGQTLNLPPNYIDLLRDAMAGHEMPVEMESRFVQSMAWRDFRIAELSINGWDGDGYLVIVAGRGHVEGGKGTAWQAQQMVDAPVHSFVLAWADSPCYPGDKVWRPTLWERLPF